MTEVVKRILDSFTLFSVFVFVSGTSILIQSSRLFHGLHNKWMNEEKKRKIDWLVRVDMDRQQTPTHKMHCPRLVHFTPFFFFYVSLLNGIFKQNLNNKFNWIHLACNSASRTWKLRKTLNSLLFFFTKTNTKKKLDDCT